MTRSAAAAVVAAAKRHRLPIHVGLAALLSLLPLLDATRVWKLRTQNPTSTVVMRARNGESLPGSRALWIPYTEIPLDLRRAVVAGEDIHFFVHAGIDYAAMRSALTTNALERRVARGGSTIPQQLAKNLFLSERRTVTRKLREAELAIELDLILEKKRILEIYLNVIEWGRGIYGCEGAARHFFGKPVASIDLEEALTLAAIIPSPLRCDPLERCPTSITDRRERIRSLLTHQLIAPERFR